MENRAPFPREPDEFEHDDRISFAKDKQTFILEDHDGKEWEWRQDLGKWSQVWTEHEAAQHAQSYGTEEAEEETVNPSKKRKKLKEHDQSNSKAAKVDKPKVNKAIWITNLPPTATVDQLISVFGKFGLIAESVDDNSKRVKLYFDAAGVFNGNALVVYHRPESVENACNLADGTELDALRPNPNGPMQVNPSDANYQKANAEAAADGAVPEEKNVGSGHKAKYSAGPGRKPKHSIGSEHKAKQKEKAQKMDSLLADWSEDEEDVVPRSKTAIVMNVFRPIELQSDPDLREDLELDMKEEAEKHGEVDKFRMFDKEPEGVVALHFLLPDAAEGFVKAVDGRKYSDRILRAHIAHEGERYKMESTRDGVKYEEMPADFDEAIV